MLALWERVGHIKALSIAAKNEVLDRNRHSESAELPYGDIPHKPMITTQSLAPYGGDLPLSQGELLRDCKTIPISFLFHRRSNME